MPTSEGRRTTDNKIVAYTQSDSSLYRSIFEDLDQGFGVIEVILDDRERPVDFRLILANPAFEHQAGLSDAVGRNMRTLLPDGEQWLDICGDVAMTGGSKRFEHGVPALGHWYEVYAFRVGGSEDNRVAIIFNDIAARKRAERSLEESERRLKRLLLELQHRVRNTLAVIRSIVRRSAGTSKTVDDYAMHLDGRIAAYARIQSTITQDLDSGIELDKILADTLQAALAREGEQVRISGPSIVLRSRAAEAVGLALHELTTNAVKFGALATRRGQIDVNWTVDEQPAGQVLDFHWIEKGLAIPPPSPLSEGFGAEQIKNSLAYDLKAETSLDVSADRIGWHIRIPLEQSVLKRDV